MSITQTQYLRATKNENAVIWRATRAELTKLVTLLSTRITLATTILGTAALAFVYTKSVSTGLPLSADEALALELYAVPYGLIGFIVLGSLAGGSEYSDDQIRVSLSAVPRRALFLFAKLGALVLVSTAAAIVTVAGSFLASQLGLGTSAAAAPRLDEALRSGSGATLYLVVMTVLALFLGVASRSALVPLVGLISLSQAVSFLLVQLPDPLGTWARFLPDVAGRLLFAESPARSVLNGSQGGLVAVAWSAAIGAIALYLLRRRDA